MANELMLATLFSAMALAIALFSCFMIIVKRNTQSATPLLMLLFSLAVLSTGPIIFTFAPILVKPYIVLLPMVFFILLPCFWLYHESLIIESPWQWTTTATRHFYLLPLIGALSLSLALLPSEIFEQMFFSDRPLTTGHAKLTATGFFLATMVWCGMSLAYAIQIFRRTMQYHFRLKQVFASEKGKMMWWVQSLTVLMIFAWLYALIVLAVDDQLNRYGVSETGVILLLLIIVWCLSAFGLYQRPGFAEVFTIDKKAKYERSALESVDLQRIADKIEKAVKEDKLYLDENLNLHKLAEHIGAPSQYVTQTLNQHLQIHFFDYINQARIDAAKPLLIKGEQTVLAIAIDVGFNARSSFYKAFKKHTGMTPGEFKVSR